MRSTIVGVMIAVALGIGAGVVIGNSGDDGGNDTALKARARTSTTERATTTTSFEETTTTELVPTYEVAAAAVDSFSPTRRTVSASRSTRTGTTAKPAATVKTNPTAPPPTNPPPTDPPADTTTTIDDPGPCEDPTHPGYPYCPENTTTVPTTVAG